MQSTSQSLFLIFPKNLFYFLKVILPLRRTLLRANPHTGLIFIICRPPPFPFHAARAALWAPAGFFPLARIVIEEHRNHRECKADGRQHRYHKEQPLERVRRLRCQNLLDHRIELSGIRLNISAPIQYEAGRHTCDARRYLAQEGLKRKADSFRAFAGFPYSIIEKARGRAMPYSV